MILWSTDEAGMYFAIYPIRNNAPLLCSPATAGLGFIIVPTGFYAPVEFLTGFTSYLSQERIDHEDC
jgi:hypothetical protein